jgi:predicted Zn finger-like uncharacterized protein
VEPEITFIVAYQCPACRAALEAKSGLAQGWVRCPKCGRASLPPEHMRAVPRARATTEPAGEGDDVLFIGPDPGPRTLNPIDSGSPAPVSISGRSVLFGAGFVISLFLALVSILDQNTINAGIFGFLALLMLALWSIPFRRR